MFVAIGDPFRGLIITSTWNNVSDVVDEINVSLGRVTAPHSSQHTVTSTLSR